MTDETEDRFRVQPGSEEARNEGCICDPQEPDADPVKIEKLCPIHGLAELQEQLKK